MSTYFCSNSLIMNWAAALLTPALAQADLWLGARGGWQRLSALQPAGLLLLLYPASPGNCGDMLHTRLFVWQTSISSVSHTANSSWSLQHSMAVAVWLQTCPPLGCFLRTVPKAGVSILWSSFRVWQLPWRSAPPVALPHRASTSLYSHSLPLPREWRDGSKSAAHLQRALPKAEFVPFSQVAWRWQWSCRLWPLWP